MCVSLVPTARAEYKWDYELSEWNWVPEDDEDYVKGSGSGDGADASCFQAGTDLHGADIGGSFCTYGAESAADCQDFCANDPGCHYFTYVPAGPLSREACCWLKAESGWTVKINDGVVSGPKSCLRLVGGSGKLSYDGRPLDGRLEVFHAGEWGTVCNDDWDDNSNNAKAACQQLGFWNGVYFNMYDSDVEEGTGRIWLDEVNCNPASAGLADCAHNDWGDHDCQHFEDVGLTCED